MTEFTTAFLKSEYRYRTEKIRADREAAAHRAHPRPPRRRRVVLSSDTSR